MLQKGISMNVLPETLKMKFREVLNLPADANYIDLNKIDFDSLSFCKIAEYFFK